MRQAGCIVLALFGMGAALNVLAAETFPSKSIRLIVPFPPGGLSDGLARFIARSRSENRVRPLIAR